jgi:hypothetical protein
MMLRRGHLGRELVLYQDWNALQRQTPPSEVLNLRGCELKVKSQGQVVFLLMKNGSSNVPPPSDLNRVDQ